MRELERNYNVGWRTVRTAVDSAWPEPRKPLPPRPSALDPYEAVIDGILRAGLDAPRKQRHMVTRIFHRLVEEHGANVSYPMVRRYVADRRPQIAVEAGKAPIEAFVPQTHPPGMEAEVDFGDVAVRLAGELGIRARPATRVRPAGDQWLWGVGDRDVSARVASCPPSAGHQAAALGDQ